MSDISDGDIPDAPADDFDDDKNNDELSSARTKQRIASGEAATASNNLNGGQNGMTASSNRTRSSSENQKLVAIAEDIEEISDVEAEWSDVSLVTLIKNPEILFWFLFQDGDCFYPNSARDFEVDFGDDWVDPIVALTKSSVLDDNDSLKYFGREAVGGVADLDEDQMARLKAANESAVNNDWVENHLEPMTESLLKTSSGMIANPGDKRVLLDTIRRGLSLAEAMTQPLPTFKVRHLKSGLKLTLAIVKKVQNLDRHELDTIQECCLNLITEQHMAASLKLLILKVVEDSLLFPEGMDLFISSGRVETIVSLAFKTKQSTRVKTALASLINKANFNEVLETLKNSVVKQEHEAEDVLANLIERVLTFVRGEAEERLAFLPVTSEVADDLFKIMDQHNFLSLILAALAKPSVTDRTVQAVTRLLKQMSSTKKGLFYLASHAGVVNQLCQIMEEDDVGAGLAYSLHAVKCLDKLYFLCEDKSNRADLETMEVLEAIQSLYGLTFTNEGKCSLINVLSKSDLLGVIIRLAKHSEVAVEPTVNDENNEENAAAPPKKDMKKSAIRGYACELLLLVIRSSETVEFLFHFNSELLDLGKSDETSKLNELTSWLGFLEDKTSLIWESENKHVSKQQFHEFFFKFKIMITILEFGCCPVFVRDCQEEHGKGQSDEPGARDGHQAVERDPVRKRQ